MFFGYSGFFYCTFPRCKQSRFYINDKYIMKHLKDTGFTYFGHMIYALKLLLKCQVVSVKLFIHAILPFFFEDTGWKNLGK